MVVESSAWVFRNCPFDVFWIEAIVISSLSSRVMPLADPIPCVCNVIEGGERKIGIFKVAQMVSLPLYPCPRARYFVGTVTI